MTSLNPRLTLKIGSLAAALLAVLGYALFQAHEFILGPKLSIDQPVNGTVISSSSPEVLLKGRAANIAYLTINGSQAFIDENGYFSRKLLLPEGLAIITVEAQDKFSRSVKKEIQLFVK